MSHNTVEKYISTRTILGLRVDTKRRSGLQIKNVGRKRGGVNLAEFLGSGDRGKMVGGGRRVAAVIRTGSE